MPQPFNYSGILAEQPSGGMTDVVRNAIFGVQQQQQNDNLLAQQQFAAEQARKAAIVAEQRRAQQQQLWGDMVKAPTAQNVFAYTSAFPEISEGVKRAYDILQPAQQQAELRTMVDVHAALTGGNDELAKSILKAREESDAKAGIDTSHYGKLAEIIDADPKHAAGLGRLALAAVLGKDKFADTYGKLGDESRAQAKLPAEIQEGQAKADKATAEADAAPQVIQSGLAKDRAQVERWHAQTQNEIDQMKLGWAQLNLDTDKLATETQLKLDEMAQKGGEVTGASLEAMTKAVGAAQQSEALATRADDLATQIETSGAMSGFGMGGFSEWLKKSTGNQNAVSLLRSQYQQIVNSQAIASLPPGPASDRDIATVKEGYPSATASPSYIASFLRGMAKLQRITATGSQRQADWISANGNIGTAKRDIDVGGVLVPKGTTFAEFNKARVGEERKGELPPGIAALVNRFGGRK